MAQRPSSGIPLRVLSCETKYRNGGLSPLCAAKSRGGASHMAGGSGGWGKLKVIAAERDQEGERGSGTAERGG